VGWDDGYWNCCRKIKQEIKQKERQSTEQIFGGKRDTQICDASCEQEEAKEMTQNVLIEISV